MRKQKDLKQKKRSMNLLFSYLLIMVAPAAAIILIYFAAKDILMEVQKEKAYRFLTEAAVSFDRQTEEIKNVGFYISENRELGQYLRKTGSETETEQFYEMYQIAQSFPEYTLTNRMIDKVYLFFRDKSYLMQLPSVIPASELGFLTVNNFEEMSYPQVIELFCGEYKYSDVMNISKTANKSNTMIVQSLPAGNGDVYDGAIVISLKDSEILELLKSGLQDFAGTAALLDEEGNIVRLYGEEAVAENAQGATWEEYLEKSGVPMGDMVETSVKTQYSRWTFCTLISKEVMIGKFGSVKYVMVSLCVLSILIGFGVCLIYWYRRKEAVEKYFDFSDNMGGGLKKSDNFWSNFNIFLDKVESLQTQVTYQEMLVRNSILRKLLYGGYETQEELDVDLHHSSIDLTAEGYFVVVLESEDPLKNGIFENIQAFQSYFLEHLEMQFSIPHMTYEIMPLRYGVIVLGADELTEEILKEIFEEINYKFYSEKRIEIFTGISRRVNKLMRLGSAYEEAARVCDYAGFYNIRMPLLETDMPEGAESFVFSIEKEMQLENAIRRGTMEELDGSIQEIRDYYLQRLIEPFMMRHFMEMLRCTVIRSLEKTPKEEEVSRILERVKEAKRPEELFLEIRETKAYLLKHTKEDQENENQEIKQKLRDFIEEKYKDADFCLLKVAEEFGVSESRMYKNFKSYFGVTFSEYLEQVRIRNACRFLKEQMAVKDVAVQVGYSSDYTFRRAFKRVMGITPSDFQRSLNSI